MIEHYLGDGLYASFDGYQIRLRAPRAHGDHEVYLEPQVLQEFLRYLTEVGIISKRKDDHGRKPFGLFVR